MSCCSSRLSATANVLTNSAVGAGEPGVAGAGIGATTIVGAVTINTRI